MPAPVQIDAIALGYAVLLLVGLPVLSTGEETIRRALEETDDRRALYLSAAFSLALLAGTTWAIAAWRGVEPAALGWRGGGLGTGLAWGAAAAAGGLSAVWAATRSLRRAGFRETDVVLLLLPRSSGEKAAFLALVLLGAVCEEYVFRGFAMHAVETWGGGTATATAVAVAVTSVSFGLAHGYQRTSGVVRATLMGLVLAVPVVATGSLFGAVAAHFWINAVIGLGGWRWFIDERTPT